MEAWTDERLDDLAASLRPLPAQLAEITHAVEANTTGLRRLSIEVSGVRDELRGEIFGLRGEVTGLRDGLYTEISGVRQDLSAVQRQMAQVGWALAFALLAAVIAALTL